MIKHISEEHGMAENSTDNEDKIEQGKLVPSEIVVGTPLSNGKDMLKNQSMEDIREENIEKGMKEIPYDKRSDELVVEEMPLVENRSLENISKGENRKSVENISFANTETDEIKPVGTNRGNKLDEILYRTKKSAICRKH
jgi:hypothetical protein